MQLPAVALLAAAADLRVAGMPDTAAPALPRSGHRQAEGNAMTDDNGRTVSDGVTTAGNGSLPELSRRFVLRGAAGAGITGLAATALVSGSVSQALAASASDSMSGSASNTTFR